MQIRIRLPGGDRPIIPNQKTTDFKFHSFMFRRRATLFLNFKQCKGTAEEVPAPSKWRLIKSSPN
jgi:hypothetical protein